MTRGGGGGDARVTLLLSRAKLAHRLALNRDAPLQISKVDEVDAFRRGRRR